MISWACCYIYMASVLWPGGVFEGVISSFTFFVAICITFPAEIEWNSFLLFSALVGNLVKLMLIFQQGTFKDLEEQRELFSKTRVSDTLNIRYHRHMDQFFTPEKDYLSIILVLSSIPFFFYGDIQIGVYVSVMLLMFLSLFYSSVISHGNKLMSFTLAFACVQSIKEDWVVILVFLAITSLLLFATSFLMHKWDMHTLEEHLEAIENEKLVSKKPTEKTHPPTKLLQPITLLSRQRPLLTFEGSPNNQYNNVNN